jgi:lactoylglutathione lyase
VPSTFGQAATQKCIVIGRLGLIMLIVDDLERSVRFYCERLGLTMRFASATWTELDAGGVSLALRRAGKDVGVGATTGCTLAFFVEDVRGTIEQLRARGIRIVEEPRDESFGGLLATISDLDGYRIHLVEFSGANHGENRAPGA